MRIPNYLRLSPSGIWHFRQRIPSCLARQTGKAEVTKSLGTRDLLIAQCRALSFVRGYAQAHTIRGLSVIAKDGIPTVSEIARAIALRYRVTRHPDGTVEIEASGRVDHEFAMDALERIGPLSKEPYFEEFMRASRAAESSPAPPSDGLESKIPAIQIGKAVTLWLAEIKSSSKPKTLSIKATAVEGFAKHYGERNSLKDVGRIDVGAWVQALRAGGLETPTIVNKCSYLRGFFDWTKARGYYPSFTKGENPAAGQIIFGIQG